ncbi:hypothetical protein Gasu2_68950 [Galdieria sulphuraria]|nr:hypothetical protein Gasu2_68950 [Galdieria sulphuraria]
MIEKSWTGNSASALSRPKKVWFGGLSKTFDTVDIFATLFIKERRSFSKVFEDYYRRCKKMECNITGPYPLLKLLIIVDIKNFKDEDIESRLPYILSFFKKMESPPLVKMLLNRMPLKHNLDKSEIFSRYFDNLEFVEEQSQSTLLDILSHRCHSVIFLEWETTRLLQLILRQRVTEWLMYLDNWTSALQLLDDSQVRKVIYGSSLYSIGWILRPSCLQDFQDFLELRFLQPWSERAYSGLYQVGEPNFRCLVRTIEWTYRLYYPSLTFNSLSLVFDFISLLENQNICAPFLSHMFFVHFPVDTRNNTMISF